MTEEAESSSRATVSPLERPGVKAILIFIAAAYALSIMLSLIVGSSGGHESALVGLAYLSMFLPAVSVLIVSSATNEPPRVRWDHFPLRYLPVALFLLRIEDPQ